MPTVRYTTINGRVIAEKRGGVRKLYRPDHLGSTIALYDNTQAKTDTWVYWPYGAVRTRTGTTATPFQFVGVLGYFRDSSDRTYVRARFFRQTLGIWQTRDPIGWIRVPYAYANSAPTVLVDITGQQASYPGPAHGVPSTIGFPGSHHGEPAIWCLHSNGDYDLVKKHFLDVCRKRLSLMPPSPLRDCMEKLCPRLTIKCDCGPNCFDDRAGWTLLIIGSPLPSLINICPRGLKQKLAGCLGETIIHEMCHACGIESESQCELAAIELYNHPNPPCPDQIF